MTKVRRLAAIGVLCAVVLLVGCSSPSTSGSSASIEGTSWKCMQIKVSGSPSIVPASDHPITAKFGTDDTLTGNSGVNDYSTTYKVDGQNLTIDSNIVSTKMAGDQKTMDIESSYLTVLPTVKSFKIEDNGQLVLFGPAQNTVARYEPEK